MKHVNLVMFVAAVLIVAPTIAIVRATAPSPLAARHRVPKGLYAGQHASLRVEAKRSEIDLECAHGSIAEVIRVDSSGTFDVAGVLAREGGPRRFPERPVRVIGAISKRTIVFTIRDDPFQPGSETYGPFTVTLGEKAGYAKCV